MPRKKEVVTDLAEFYRAQGRRQERERIVKWLEAVEREIEKPGSGEDEMTTEEQTASLAIVLVLREKLVEEPA